MSRSVEFMLLELDLTAYPPRELEHVGSSRAPEACFRLFGVTARGETVFLAVTDARPLFYVQPPVPWSGYELAAFERGLREALDRDKYNSSRGLARV